MDHGQNIHCQHRDANGDHYPNCPLPECIDGVLCCEVHTVKDGKPAVAYDVEFGGRLCRECADGAVAATKCAVCPTDHGVEAVALVNGSTIRLCARCRTIHQALVAEVEADDMVVEEAADQPAEVAMIGDLDTGSAEPFCACGRRFSQCDRSRAGCTGRADARCRVTRAIPVIVERSPGGLSAFAVRIDGKAKFLIRTTEAVAIEFAVRKLGLLGAGPIERARIASLLRSELGRLRRAEVTAEIPVCDERQAA